MIGWWEQDVPVKTGRDDVLATVYQKNDRSLIAIASWAKQAANIRLQIDWQKLGIDPHRAKLTAPAIDAFQNANSFSPDRDISVPSGRGYLLVLEEA